MATTPKNPYRLVKDTYAASNGRTSYDVIRVADGKNLGRIRKVAPGAWLAHLPGHMKHNSEFCTQRMAGQYLAGFTADREAAAERIGFQIGTRTVDAPYSELGRCSGRWSSRRVVGRLLIETDVLPDRILVHSRVIGTPTEADKVLMANSFGGDYLPVRVFPRNLQVAAQEEWTTDGHWPVLVDTDDAQV